MQKLITLSIIASMTGLCYSADPEAFLKKQKAVYLAKIGKAAKAAEAAKKKQEQEVLVATKAYIKDLEKVKVYWTKQGKLEKAMEFKRQIDEMQKQVDAGKVKTKSFEDVENLLPAKHTRLIGKTFDFYSGGHKIGTFTLASGGKLRGYTHANETYWKVFDGYLHIIPSNRKLGSTRYQVAKEKEPMILLASHFLTGSRNALALYEVKK